MAGKITVSTINDDTGVLATQNGMTGIAKAWCNFNGTGTPAIRGSFNVSSITDNGTGNYTLNFTTAMPNADYVLCGVTDNSNGVSPTFVCLFNGGVATTSAIQFTTSSTGANYDNTRVNVAVFSS